MNSHHIIVLYGVKDGVGKSAFDSTYYYFKI